MIELSGSTASWPQWRTIAIGLCLAVVITPRIAIAGESGVRHDQHSEDQPER
jgi:hypothetical protein